MPAPVPSRLLLPSLEAEHPRALQNRLPPLVHPCGTCRGQYPSEERADPSTALWAFPGASEAQGLAAPAQGDVLLPLWGQNSPTIKLGK